MLSRQVRAARGTRHTAASTHHVEFVVPRFACRLFALCLLAVPAFAQEEAAPAPPPRDRVREAVDAGNYFFVKAFAARDAQAVADLYTEDARVIAPGAEPANGRAAIAAFWTKAMEDTVAVRLETLSVESAGELHALEEGLAHLTASDGTESTARYLVVWKRAGRRWHLHRDIWNTGPLASAPPAVTPPPEPAPEAKPEPAGDEALPGEEEPPPEGDEPAPDQEPV